MVRRQADVVVTSAVAVLACVAVVSRAPTVVMAVLGVALFAAPGYLLSQLLFSSRIGGLERAVVATGLALGVPIVGGLLLDAAGVPLHRASWLGLLAAVTLLADVVLLIRRRAGRVAPFTWRLAGWRLAGWRLPPWHATAFAAAVLVGACGLGLARLGAAVQPQPGFTQLWLTTGPEKEPSANLGVSNDQGITARYHLVLMRNGHVRDAWNLTLADGQTWQRTVPYSGKDSLAADLYRLPDLIHPYRHVATGSQQAPRSSPTPKPALTP